MSIASDIAAAGTALAGLILVYLGAAAVRYETLDPKDQASARDDYRRHEREPHRDSRKPAHRPEPDNAASRTKAFDVRIAVGGKLFDGGGERIHPRVQNAPKKEAWLGGFWEPNVDGPRFNPMLRDEELLQWRLLLEALTPDQRRKLLVAVLKMVKIEDEGRVTPIRPQSGRA